MRQQGNGHASGAGRIGYSRAPGIDDPVPVCGTLFATDLPLHPGHDAVNLNLAFEPTHALAAAPCIATPANDDRPDNLRLGKLLAEWESRRRKSPSRARALVDRFLEEVESLGGSPLIEHAGRSRGYYHRGEAWRVTFLWDGRQHPARQVVLHAGLASLAPVDTVFRHLGETGLRYLSLVLPEGSALSYCLVAGPDQDMATEDHEALRNWIDAYRLVDPLNRRTWPDRDSALARSRLDSLPAGRPGRVYSLVDVPGVAPSHGVDDVGIRGRWQHGRLRSAFLGNEREIYLYRPRTGDLAGGDGSLRLLFVFDGEAWQTQYLTSLVLDRLQAEGRIAPTAAVFVSNVERDRELTPNADFARFMANELLPWVRMQVEGASLLPSQVIASGFSFGGLAAAWLGYREPDAFGNVLSSSGSFWWTPGPDRPRAMLDTLGDSADDGADGDGRGSDDRDGTRDSDGPGAWNGAPNSRIDRAGACAGGVDGGGDGDCAPGDDWLTRQFISAPRLPVRFFLSAGRLETGADGMAGILDNHRRIRDVLRARGYQVRDREGPGGHEFLEWARALVAGLPTLVPAAR